MSEHSYNDTLCKIEQIHFMFRLK